MVKVVEIDIFKIAIVASKSNIDVINKICLELFKLYQIQKRIKSYVFTSADAYLNSAKKTDFDFVINEDTSILTANYTTGVSVLKEWSGADSLSQKVTITFNPNAAHIDTQLLNAIRDDIVFFITNHIRKYQTTDLPDYVKITSRDMTRGVNTDFMLPIKEIAFITTKADYRGYVEFVLVPGNKTATSKPFLVKGTLEDWAEKLPSCICQAHQSYLVNKNNVRISRGQGQIYLTLLHGGLFTARKRCYQNSKDRDDKNRHDTYICKVDSMTQLQITRTYKENWR